MNSRALSQIGRSRSLNLEISIYSYSSYNSLFGAYEYHMIQYNTFIVMKVVMIMIRMVMVMKMVMKACLVSSGRDGVKFNFTFFASTALGATTSIFFSWTQWSG